MPLLNPNSILGNPLAMAGLGLLAQPTRSRNPMNPMGAVLGGLQAAGQYQQNQAITAGQQQELQMRQQQMQFEMEEALRKREQEAVAAAEAQRQQQAIEAQIASLPPEQQAIARLNPEAYAKSAAGALFQKPTAEPAAVQTYRLTHPEDATLAGFDAWNRENKRSGAMNSTLEVKQFPPPPTGYYYNDPTNPAAGLSPLPGGPADPSKKDLTESQANATMFYSRAKEMDQKLGASGYNATGIGAAKDRMMAGGALTNWAASDEGQAYINQGKNFVAAILRKESGAAITNEEWATGQQLYVDMPGDSPELRRQKAQNRKLAIEGMKVASGPGAERLPQGASGTWEAPTNNDAVSWDDL